MALGGLVSGALGAILGNDAGKDEMANSLRLNREALAALQKIYIPTTEEQEINSEGYTPELAELLKAATVDGTALAGISTDPRLENANRKALEQIAGLADTGWGIQDQYGFDQARKQSGAEAQAQQATILSRAAEDGVSDAGMTTNAQLMAAQQQANRLNQSGALQAAQAAEARRQAIGMMATQANALSQQDYNRKANTATAKDIMDKFNAQNIQQANQYNTTNKQNINNTTAANKKEADYYNSGLIQQQFQNNLSKATGVAGQTNNLAQTYANQGTAKSQGQANMNSAILGIGGNLLTAGMSGAAKTAATQAAPTTASTVDPGNQYDDYYMNEGWRK